MKKQTLRALLVIATIAGLQTGCNPGEQRTDDAKQQAVTPAPRLRDTLKIYLDARKMESAASSLAQSGAYDSALSRYNKITSILNTALEENNHAGLNLFAGVIIEINEAKEVIYDSLHQAENSISSTLECLKWAKLIHNYTLQITSDTKAADKLKNSALSNSDTAKKENLCREALLYALAGARVIDSLKTNDMDDLRYATFHCASKIYAAMGNKTQAHIYDKKYKHVYFKIYRHMPEDK